MDTLFNETRAFIISKIASLLERGETKLPTDQVLASEITASYATLRLVMNELNRQGYIRRIRGSGTYLTPNSAELLAEYHRHRLHIYSPHFQADSSRYYGAWLLETLKSAAKTRGWKCLHTQVESNKEFIERIAHEEATSDAVIFIPPSEVFSLDVLGKMSCLTDKPLLVLDRELPNIALNNVTTDNRKGGILAARHLLEHGHRKIAVLISEPLLVPQAEARIQGFNDILEAEGCQAERIYCNIRMDELRVPIAQRVMQERLQRPYDFTAVFAISDAGAMGALEAFKAQGLTVGKDISLVGFDGIRIGEQCTPPLTTIVQPVESICRTAFAILEANSSSYHYEQIAPTLRIGASVADIN